MTRRREETHAVVSSSGYSPLLDSMPAIVDALQRYYATHDEVENLSSIIEGMNFEEDELCHLEQGLIAAEFERIKELLVLLKDSLENDKTGRDRIFNDSGVSLHSLIGRFEAHIWYRETQASFKSAGDLQAWLAGELLSRKAR